MAPKVNKKKLQERRVRGQKCMEELAEVLKAHRCSLEAQVTLSAAGYKPEVIVVPQE